MIRIVFLKAEY